MKAVLLGGLIALSLGVAAGASSHGLVGSVVSSDAGSRLELASVAAPPAATPWAEGDTSAPQYFLTSAVAAPAYAPVEHHDIRWSTPPEAQQAPRETPVEEPADVIMTDAEPVTGDAVNVVDPAAESDPAPLADFMFESQSEDEPASELDPELTVASLAP